MDFGNPFVTAIVALLVICLVVGRQLTDRPMSGRTVTLPLVLTAVGVWTLVQAHPAVTATGVVLTAVQFVVAAGLGALTGRTVHLFHKDGVLHQRGGLLTLGLWVLTIGTRVGLVVLGGALGAGALTTATLTLSFGITLAAQALVLQQRVRAGLPGPDHARIAG